MPEQMRHLSKWTFCAGCFDGILCCECRRVCPLCKQNGELAVNGMASQQAGYALAAYDRFKKERTHCMICLMQSHYISDPWRQRM